MDWEHEPSSASEHSAVNAVALKKEIGVLQGVSIIFGVIVGSGIFVSPVGVLHYSHSVGLSLIIWIITGLFSILGALVYAELGVRIPKSGGEYAYILTAFGGLPAFICMWITFVIIGAVACATNSLLFARYILQPFYQDCAQPDSVVKAVAISGLMLICAINCYKVKWATHVAVLFSAGKVLALLLIIGFGIYHLATGKLESFDNMFEGSTTSPGELSLAFYQGFWAFAGWNYLNFLVEEMKDPGRNLPLAIVIGLSLVTGLYMMANLAYLAVLTPTEMLGSGDGSAAVAVMFADRAMPWFSLVMPIFVGASVFGSINGEVMSMSRLTFTGAREGHMPIFLAMVHQRNLTPLPSILALMLLGIGFQFYSNLFKLIELAGFAFSLIAALAVLALIWLRYKEPHVKSSFQLPIIFSIVFLFCDVFILILTVYQQPWESLLNLILMLSAVPIYLIGVSWQSKPKKFTKFIHKSTLVLQKVFHSVPVDNVPDVDQATT